MQYLIDQHFPAVVLQILFVIVEVHWSNLDLIVHLFLAISTMLLLVLSLDLAYSLLGLLVLFLFLSVINKSIRLE